MIYEINVRGKLVTYDSDKDKVFENGNLSYELKPVFIPNGDNEPDFFGIADTHGKVYDIYGNVREVVNADKITL